MAWHIASVFDMRLREDVSSLRTLIEGGLPLNPDNNLGRAENPSIFFTTHIAPTDVLGTLWNTEDSEGRGRAALVEILRLYNPSFDWARYEAALNVAIPNNPLGMLYRLLTAAHSDIRSWNETDQFDLDARIAQKKALIDDIDGNRAGSKRIIKTVEQKVRERFPEGKAVDIVELHTTYTRRGEIFYFGGNEHEPHEMTEVISNLGITPDEENLRHADHEFLEAVHRIIGRHFNKRILERMAENVKAMSGSSSAAAGAGRGAVSMFGLVSREGSMEAEIARFRAAQAAAAKAAPPVPAAASSGGDAGGGENVFGF
jgi:hypothetical protein